MEAAVELLISPLEGVEEWSAQRTESQLLGFSSDERPAGQKGSHRVKRDPLFHQG
jgi:hypothetical protein